MKPILEFLESNLEKIAEEVHNAWWEEKKNQGFHPPTQCIDWSFGCNQFKKICDYCHTDMYPYNELPENIKEYDRVTVRSVIKAIKNITSA